MSTHSPRNKKDLQRAHIYNPSSPLQEDMNAALSFALTQSLAFHPRILEWFMGNGALLLKKDAAVVAKVTFFTLTRMASGRSRILLASGWRSVASGHTALLFQTLITCPSLCLMSPLRASSMQTTKMWSNYSAGNNTILLVSAMGGQ